MGKNNVYVLEHFEAKQPTVIGIFSSRKKAEKTLKDLPKKYAYASINFPGIRSSPAGRNCGISKEPLNIGTTEQTKSNT